MGALAYLTANAGAARIVGKHLVVPMTLIVPGVLNGSKGALYYPPEEIAKNIAAWNGMPLTLYHPSSPLDAGYLPAAAAPHQHLGSVKGARLDGGRLRADAWFDIGRVRQLNKPLYNALMAGEKVELSTGLYTTNVPKAGTYNGVPYTHTATAYRPDHVAILPDQVGACSIVDGCGVNNKKGDTKNMHGYIDLVQDPDVDPEKEAKDKSKVTGNVWSDAAREAAARARGRGEDAHWQAKQAANTMSEEAGQQYGKGTKEQHAGAADAHRQAQAMYKERIATHDRSTDEGKAAYKADKASASQHGEKAAYHEKGAKIAERLEKPSKFKVVGNSYFELAIPLVVNAWSDAARAAAAEARRSGKGTVDARKLSAKDLRDISMGRTADANEATKAANKNSSAAVHRAAAQAHDFARDAHEKAAAVATSRGDKTLADQHMKLANEHFDRSWQHSLAIERKKGGTKNVAEKCPECGSRMEDGECEECGYMRTDNFNPYHGEGGRFTDADSAGAHAKTKEAVGAADKAERSGRSKHHAMAHEAHMEAAAAHRENGNDFMAQAHESRAKYHAAAASLAGRGEAAKAANPGIRNSSKGGLAAHLIVNGCACSSDFDGLMQLNERTLLQMANNAEGGSSGGGGATGSSGGGMGGGGGGGSGAKPRKKAEGSNADVNPDEDPEIAANEWLASAPRAVQSVVRNAMQAERSAKGRLIEALTSNLSGKERQQQVQYLQNRSMEELKNIARIAGANNYLGAAGGAETFNTSSDVDANDILPLPTMNWKEESA